MSCNYNKVLDLIKANQWDEAHHLVQDYADKHACLLHGYLHRIEGDFSNADYWYRRAGEARINNTLEAEFERLEQLIRRL